MMKLGLLIEITSQGADVAKTYNSSIALEKYASASRSFIKDVFPAREELRTKGKDLASSLDESGRSVVFLRFLGPDGYLICSFQARPENSGRPYDGAAAWIHVPDCVQITGKETEKLIDDVEEALSGTMGINYQKLEEIFNKEYKHKKVFSALSRIGSNGTESGIRYYGTGTNYDFSDLFGDNVAQQVYGNYKAVFFLRKNDGFAVNASEITTPLIPTCVMSAPSSMYGYNAFLENRQFCDFDLECPENSPLTIVWKKTGYQDIPKSANARKGNSNEIANLFGITKEDIKLVVRKEIFSVVCEGRSVRDYKIYIEGKEIDDFIYLQEDILSDGVQIQIIAHGCEPYENNHQITKDTKQIHIKMNRKIYRYKFTIPLYDAHGEEIKEGEILVELEQRLKKCPIKGYSLKTKEISDDNVPNHLKRRGFIDAVKHFMYGFMSCVGIILVIFLVIKISNIKQTKWIWGWPPVKFEWKSESQAIEIKNADDAFSTENNGPQLGASEKADSIVKKNSELENKAAIEYLNNNQKWHKDSINHYVLLQGLFEALNEFKYEEITTTWAVTLKNVPNFQKVVYAAKNAIKQNYTRKERTESTYNTENDHQITIDKYINWISKKRSPTSNNTLTNELEQKKISRKETGTSSQNENTRNLIKDVPN